MFTSSFVERAKFIYTFLCTVLFLLFLLLFVLVLYDPRSRSNRGPPSKNQYVLVLNLRPVFGPLVSYFVAFIGWKFLFYSLLSPFCPGGPRIESQIVVIGIICNYYTHLKTRIYAVCPHTLQKSSLIFFLNIF